MKVAGIIQNSVVNGIGVRDTIFFQGCEHHCPGCHNPESWDENGGEELSVDDLLRVIVNDPFAHVTLSGGDPLLQAEGCAELAQRVKQETDKTIWCYTGYTWESLLAKHDPIVMSLLENLDVLVDGPFIQSLRDTSLLFRGSSNQRLIDVQKSLSAGEVILWQR
mgnify:CR=1 FL=1